MTFEYLQTLITRNNIHLLQVNVLVKNVPFFSESFNNKHSFYDFYGSFNITPTISRFRQSISHNMLMYLILNIKVGIQFKLNECHTQLIQIIHRIPKKK